MPMTLAELEQAVTDLTAEVSNLPSKGDIDNLSTLINTKHTTFLNAVNNLNDQVSILRELYIALQKRVTDLESA